MISISSAPKLIWGADLDCQVMGGSRNVLALPTDAAKGCLGGQQTCSVVKRRHTKEESGPGSCSKMGAVVREATSQCQLKGTALPA